VNTPLNTQSTKGYVFLKVILLAMVYLAVSTTHLFFVPKTTHVKKHKYNSIFKRKAENAISLERTEKTTVNKNDKPVHHIIRNIDLFFTSLFFSWGTVNLEKELPPPNNQFLPKHRYAYLDCSIIRV